MAQLAGFLLRLLSHLGYQDTCGGAERGWAGFQLVGEVGVVGEEVEGVVGSYRWCVKPWGKGGSDSACRYNDSLIPL